MNQIMTTPAAEALPLNQGQRLEVRRLPEHQQDFFEIKDPSVVMVSPTQFLMFASIGSSLTQRWKVGRFQADRVEGPWREVSPVTFINIQGPQLCAPAVTYDPSDAHHPWKMYIQTACFEENGVIAYATSQDGQIFTGQPDPLVTRDQVDQSRAAVVGVYDVAVSEISDGQEDLLCMVYSGYRRVGCGDLYVSYKKKTDLSSAWSTGKCLMAQEDLPFHNPPSYEHFEWGLEGAKIIQLGLECFLLIGVCFKPLPQEFAGTRQRVFMAVAKTLEGPYLPLGMPFTPIDNPTKTGENGHPDTLVIGETLHVVYQERAGVSEPWYLRYAQYELPYLASVITTQLQAQNSASGELSPSSLANSSSAFLNA